MLRTKKKLQCRIETFFCENFFILVRIFPERFSGQNFHFIIARGGVGGFSKKWPRSLRNTVVSKNVKRKTEANRSCKMDDRWIQATLRGNFEKTIIYGYKFFKISAVFMNGQCFQRCVFFREARARDSCLFGQISNHPANAAENRSWYNNETTFMWPHFPILKKHAWFGFHPKRRLSKNGAEPCFPYAYCRIVKGALKQWLQQGPEAIASAVEG